MVKVILTKHGTTRPILLAPDEESIAVLCRIPDGAEVLADLKRARNLRQLRLFWALVEIVSEASDLPKETIKKDVAIALGFTETWRDHTGRLRIAPASIAIENMEQDEFDAFMSRAVNTMATWIDAERTDLMARYNELAADKRYAGYRR